MGGVVNMKMGRICGGSLFYNVDSIILNCWLFLDCLISICFDILMVNCNLDSWNLFLSGRE